MKQLRRTIRSLILENNQHYEKLVKMILTKDLDNINQALELALAMGYVTDLQHSNPYTANRAYTKHRWELEDVDPELEAEIKRQYRIDFKSKLQIFYGMTAPKPGAISITLYAPKEI